MLNVIYFCISSLLPEVCSGSAIRRAPRAENKTACRPAQRAAKVAAELAVTGKHMHVGMRSTKSGVSSNRRIHNKTRRADRHREAEQQNLLSAANTCIGMRSCVRLSMSANRVLSCLRFFCVLCVWPLLDAMSVIRVLSRAAFFSSAFWFACHVGNSSAFSLFLFYPSASCLHMSEFRVLSRCFCFIHMLS